MMRLLHRTGFDMEDVEFVDPVVVDTLPDDYAHLTKGYYSLNSTVRDKIFQLASDAGLPHFLVLEDDVMEVVDPAMIQDRIRDILVDVPQDWDMIYLEYCMERCWKSKAVSKWLATAVKPYCTAAVIYRTASVAKLRDCLDGKKQLIDFSYVQCIQEHSLKAYVARPPLFAQNAAYEGDLGHTRNPTTIQFWLNLFIRMYPDPNEPVKSYPRLPACMSLSDLAGYVRWFNVAVMLIVLVCIVALLRATWWSQHGAKPKRPARRR